MTPPRIAVLRALSPTKALTVAELATAAFPESSAVKGRQQVYRVLHYLQEQTTSWLDGARVIVSMDGCAFSPADNRIDNRPRRWLLSPAGIVARVEQMAG